MFGSVTYNLVYDRPISKYLKQMLKNHYRIYSDSKTQNDYTIVHLPNS